MRQSEVGCIKSLPAITKKAVVGSNAALVRLKKGQVRNHVDCGLVWNLDPPARPDTQLLGGPFHVGIRTRSGGGFQDALDTSACGTIEARGCREVGQRRRT